MDLLLVEDKDSFRRLLTQALAGSVWSVCAVADPQEALRALETQPFHALVTDLRLPGMSGLELLRRARRQQPNLRVVLMSAFGEPKDIVEAMRLGADDFLPKPFDLEVFLALLDRLGSLAGAPAPDPAEPWIAHSPAMQVLDKELSLAATTELPALFRGERGSGRARAARRLHTLRQPGGPFLAFPAATLGPTGLTSQTLRMLQGGSLYLADLEQLSADAQPALLAALASDLGRGLHWMAGTGTEEPLPEPLRSRLGALVLTVPPLRDRREDLLALAQGILGQLSSQQGRPTPWLERSAERDLLAYAWPGQVRELEGVLARTLRVHQGHAIRAFQGLGLGEAEPLCLAWPEPGPLDSMVRSLAWSAETYLLSRALANCGGDLPRAAEGLGLTLRIFGQRLREHGIPLEDEGSTLPGKAP